MPCSYRIAQEGLPLLLPYITRQRVSLSAADFLRLLLERSLQLPKAANAAVAPAAEAAAEAEASPPAQAEGDEGAAADGAAAGVHLLSRCNAQFSFCAQLHLSLCTQIRHALFPLVLKSYAGITRDHHAHRNMFSVACIARF